MISLLFLLLSGVIADDLLVDQKSVEYFQERPVVAVGPEGRFAVAWRDCEEREHNKPAKVYLKFFEKDGTPVTQAIQLNQDTFCAYPRIATDGNGHFLCAWSEASDRYSYDLYGQVFDSEGNPLSERFQIEDGIQLDYAHEVSGSSQGQFFVLWDSGGDLFGQRYDTTGTRVGEEVLIFRRGPYTVMEFLDVELSDEGTAALTWVPKSDGSYCVFQLLDTENNFLIPDSFNLVTNDSVDFSTLEFRPNPVWFDEEHFGIFWLNAPLKIEDPMIQGVQGKLFNLEGDSLTDTRTVLNDFSCIPTYQQTPFELTRVYDGRYAVVYHRIIEWPSDFRIAGFLADTSFERTTGIFRVPSSVPHQDQWEGPGAAVEACSDRIVWVWADNSQQRECPEEFVPYYFDVHCKITDWDLTGIAEQPEVKSPIHLETSINRLSYKIPGEAELTIYSVDGRRVLSKTIKGKGTWTPSSQPSSHLPSGVYFARVTSPEYSVRAKVVVIR